MDNLQNLQGYHTAESRWSRFGPYYAMFPFEFAVDVINKYSETGGTILDPFAGRCSSIYAGGVSGRESLGIEINPVGWIYGTTKIQPSNKNLVKKRLLEIYQLRSNYYKKIELMHEFYSICFSKEVLSFLLAAKNNLRWKENKTDRTLMAFLLVYLHGKLGEGLSNQMRMTKSMGINYSINWWRKNGLDKPPEINPYEFMIKKIDWRYEKGIPKVTNSKVILGDSTLVLNRIINASLKTDNKYSLLFTSPPYYGLTDYYADQWLRLWLLGGSEIPKVINEKHKGRFMSKEEYSHLLDSVFSKCALVMKKKSTLYVRTDIRDFTFNTTMSNLKKYFPRHDIAIESKPIKKRTQTVIFGNKSSDPGEVDIIMKN